MEEVSVEPNDVELVIGVCLVQLLQDLHLLQTSFVPAETAAAGYWHSKGTLLAFTKVYTLVSKYSHHFVVSDDLDGDLVFSLQPVSGPHHVAEHPMARVAKHSVAPIQLLPYTHSYTR